jgi:hypothetical protein
VKAARFFKDSTVTTTGNVYTSGKGSLKLMIDLEELRQIQIEKKKYQGF